MVLKGMLAVKEYLHQYKERLEGALSNCLLSPNVEPQVVHDAMRYVVLDGGHRWRPILTMTVAEIFGTKADDVIPTACAIELIQSSTIILDDLPCMDNAELRRGRPTCHKVFGEAETILTSIALLSLAYKLILKNRNIPGIDPEAVRKVYDEAVVLTGSQGMMAGQVADLQSTGQRITRERLEHIYRQKSALFYSFSARAGAILAGAMDSELESITKYGSELGFAYQIYDDICDVEGIPEEQGKNVGMDQNKTTFVSLYGLEQAKSLVKHYLDFAMQILEPLESRVHILRDLARYIILQERN